MRDHTTYPSTCLTYLYTHHDGVAVDRPLELREVRLHAAVARQGDVPHLDPKVVARLGGGNADMSTKLKDRLCDPAL